MATTYCFMRRILVKTANIMDFIRRAKRIQNPSWPKMAPRGLQHVFLCPNTSSKGNALMVPNWIRAWHHTVLCLTHFEHTCPAPSGPQKNTKPRTHRLLNLNNHISRLQFTNQPLQTYSLQPMVPVKLCMCIVTHPEVQWQ